MGILVHSPCHASSQPDLVPLDCHSSLEADEERRIFLVLAALVKVPLPPKTQKQEAASMDIWECCCLLVEARLAEQHDGRSLLLGVAGGQGQK